MARALKYFPYEPRPYQREVASFIRLALSRGYRSICVHAPTGFGKTPVILSVLTPLMLRGARVVWAVRTGSETDRPVEELRVIVEEFGLGLFGLSYRGKRDMCLLSRRMGLRDITHEEAAYLCRSLRGGCKYYEGLKSLELDELLERPLTYSDILGACAREGACPYYAQRALLRYAGMVSLSYNYVVDERVSWSVAKLFPYHRSVLVVDEAHNLQELSLNSDRVTEGTVARALSEAEEYSLRWLAEPLAEFQDRLYELRREMERGGVEEEVVDPLSLAGELAELVPLMHKWGDVVRRDRLEEGRAPRSSLHHLAEFLAACSELAGTRGVTFLASLEGGRLSLEVWDMRASEVLSRRWGRFACVIFCSGTLKPIEAFAEIVGVSSYASTAVPSLYGERNVRAVLLTDASTRGETLSGDMRERYVAAVGEFAESLDSNVAVFVSSYRVMEELIEAGLLRALARAGKVPLVERRDMRGDEARALLSKFKELSRGDSKGALVGVMGGRFAEGADFPGRELEGVFLVGVPFERPTARVREYVKYYQELYGAEKGYFYGYVLPALRRASQAIGRALRSLDDRAVIVCGDWRYANYLDLLPDYVARTLVRAESSELGGVILRAKRELGLGW